MTLARALKNYWWLLIPIALFIVYMLISSKPKLGKSFEDITDHTPFYLSSYEPGSIISITNGKIDLEISREMISNFLLDKSIISIISEDSKEFHEYVTQEFSFNFKNQINSTKYPILFSGLSNITNSKLDGDECSIKRMNGNITKLQFLRNLDINGKLLLQDYLKMNPDKSFLFISEVLVIDKGQLLYHFNKKLEVGVENEIKNLNDTLKSNGRLEFEDRNELKIVYNNSIIGFKADTIRITDLTFDEPQDCGWMLNNSLCRSNLSDGITHYINESELSMKVRSIHLDKNNQAEMEVLVNSGDNKFDNTTMIFTAGYKSDPFYNSFGRKFYFQIMSIGINPNSFDLTIYEYKCNSESDSKISEIPSSQTVSKIVNSENKKTLVEIIALCDQGTTYSDLPQAINQRDSYDRGGNNQITGWNWDGFEVVKLNNHAYQVAVGLHISRKQYDEIIQRMQKYNPNLSFQFLELEYSADISPWAEVIENNLRYYSFSN